MTLLITPVGPCTDQLLDVTVPLLFTSKASRDQHQLEMLRMTHLDCATMQMDLEQNPAELLVKAAAVRLPAAGQAAENTGGVQAQNEPLGTPGLPAGNAQAAQDLANGLTGEDEAPALPSAGPRKRSRQSADQLGPGGCVNTMKPLHISLW